MWADLEGERREGHRLCRGCYEVKPHAEFYERSRGTDGRYSRCKSCAKGDWQVNREFHLAQKAARTYGITADEYAALMAGGCHVCGATGHQSGRRLHIDHCHRTGRVRGALCHACNTALGLAGESPGRLRQLAEYLEQHQLARPSGL